MGDESYCCKMREKFLLGIIGERSDIPTPTEAVDFIDFDAQREDKKPVLMIKFCPFCGKSPFGPLRSVQGLPE